MNKEDYAKKYRRDLYEYCTKNKICHRCYTRDIFTESGRALCQDCAEKDLERHLKVDKKHRNDLRRKLRQRHIENHECAECGKQLSQNYSRKICEHCLGIKRANYLKQHPTAFSRGIATCWLCNKNSPLENKKLCKSCYEKIVTPLIERNKIANEKHHWRLMQYGKNATTH